jgi:hypothetical protein
MLKRRGVCNTPFSTKIDHICQNTTGYLHIYTDVDARESIEAAVEALIRELEHRE